ncbi:SDR family oxidoreductase [Bdellovibrio bacteriovorus]|uniref:Putative oxidoreductase n=1 Tax=Bdellovibrio bacteriovorus (strain ATCC 15356 / DSM 50701 / NCIMB 9529 / HD100) TaxID=264462 RepID=Q6MJ77_BDEBA|nr:SDR family oxidoreductase [Bdellovibrio bacteriovorus]AHZ85389.1 quinone oxidoreductase [Bdellovibrio bacteriovorus]BEV69283.1 Quinone oxidoreductase 2 [Bdellovibrio bacteriovorus]CAE80684.1 putative oxidoreductase [Bdellovibrio bacteriovorus HD100]
MILVTGATGQLGQLVIQSLLKKVPASEIAAAVRNVQKAQNLKDLGIQVREADYNNPEAWTAALKGIQKVLLISGSEVGSRIQQHKAVIDAAKKAGTVELLVYTSLLRADTSPLVLGQEHKETEKMIQASGLRYSLLRNGWYTENYVGSAKSAVEHGAVLGAAQDGRIASASREDYAEAAAQVLTLQNPKAVYELAGDTSYSLKELAAEISKQSGKEVKYNNLSEADYKAFLIQVGLPEGFAGILAQSDSAAAQGGLYDESHELSQLIGRKTTPLAVTLAAALK